MLKKLNNNFDNKLIRTIRRNISKRTHLPLFNLQFHFLEGVILISKPVEQELTIKMPHNKINYYKR